VSTAVAGGVIAFYQVGYGIAAFGAGPVQDHGVKLSTLFGLTALVALVMAALAVVIARPAPSARESPVSPSAQIRE
jgi:predicted MFS family arabinose efflux permease